MTDELRWTDNHCHLDPASDGDAEVAVAIDAGVLRMIDVGTDVARSRQAIASAGRHPGTVWATVGVHPHDADGGIDGMAELLDHPGVVALGECGLDYHYDHSPRPVQREVFASQIGLAHDRDLPLVIHTREAWDDTFAILDAEGVPDHTVFHCFTAGPAEAEAALERGGHLSFSGVVTFKNADANREAAAMCPADRLMLETDAPYLAPEPIRGQRNSPANLPHVAAVVASQQRIGIAELAASTWETTSRFYTLD